MIPFTKRAKIVALAVAGVTLMTSAGAAQFQRRGGRFGYGQVRENPPYDGAFQFCRIMFRNASNGDGAGWSVDWPRADENLSFRLSELTRTSVIDIYYFHHGTYVGPGYDTEMTGKMHDYLHEAADTMHALVKALRCR